VVVEMKTQTNLGRSDIGGASIIVPQPKPVFRFRVKGKGMIRVYYLLKNTATITFDDGAQVRIYGTQELKGDPDLDATELVADAIIHYPEVMQNNPFSQLLENRKAMGRLAKIMKNIWSGE
jgi:hypothetical protein